MISRTRGWLGFDGLLVLWAAMLNKEIALGILNAPCFEDAIFEGEPVIESGCSRSARKLSVHDGVEA